MLPGLHCAILAAGGLQINGAWNPADKNANVTLSNNNLTMTDANSLVGSVRSTNSLAAGKSYIEFLAGGSASTTGCGCGTSSASLADGDIGLAGAASYLSNGQIFINGSLQATIASYTTSDIIGMLVDRTGGTVAWNKNNSAFSTAFTLPTGAMFLIGTSVNGRSITLNRTPLYAIPSGATYWGN